MVIFDVLDELETYSSVIPHMDDVVYVMDHSKPYDDDPGLYKCCLLYTSDAADESLPV